MSFNATSILGDYFSPSWLSPSAANLSIASFSAIAIALITISIYPEVLFPSTKSNGIPELGGISILTAWPFFTRRNDWIHAQFQRIGHIFRFKVMQYYVVAARGEAARKTYFDSKLDSLQGYKILMGGMPDLKDIAEDNYSDDSIAWFNKTFYAILNRNRLSDLLPTFFEDVNSGMEQWGLEGAIDPFVKIYELAFQSTVRIASCDELATDIPTIRRIQEHFDILEHCATPTALLLPWFPSPARRRNLASTTELFTIISGYVTARKAAKVPNPADTIDFLLARGLGDQEIVGFVLGIIFGGVINTGVNACWMITYLCYFPEWKSKVRAEVQGLLAKYTDISTSEPLHKRLSCIPITAWEDETPVIDAVMRETIRLVVNLTSFRRNFQENLAINGKVVKKGDIVAYSLYDTHMNPDMYSNPTKFDPERFAPGREEDKKGTYAYLGWGAGRHPCSGVKIAKLELKVIASLFIVGYESGVIDKAGNPLVSVPVPDYNLNHASKPAGNTCYIKFKRVVE